MISIITIGVEINLTVKKPTGIGILFNELI